MREGGLRRRGEVMDAVKWLDPLAYDLLRRFTFWKVFCLSSRFNLVLLSFRS